MASIPSTDITIYRIYLIEILEKVSDIMKSKVSLIGDLRLDMSDVDMEPKLEICRTLMSKYQEIINLIHNIVFQPTQCVTANRSEAGKYEVTVVTINYNFQSSCAHLIDALRRIHDDQVKQLADLRDIYATIENMK